MQSTKLKSIMAIALSSAMLFATAACGTSDKADAGTDSAKGSDAATITSYDVSSVEKDDTIAALLDLARAMGNIFGLETEIVSSNFDTIIPAIGSKYDLGIAAFTITKERMESVDFVSYFTAGMGYAVATGNPKNVDENDLCGLNVAVETGTVEEEAINKTAKQCKADGKKDITIQSSKQQTDATTAVVTGKADVFFADSPVVGYAIAQTDGQLEQLGKDFDEVPNAIAIKKGDSQTTEAVQKAMQKLMDDGTYTKILQHWGVESGALDKAEINPAVE